MGILNIFKKIFGGDNLAPKESEKKANINSNAANKEDVLINRSEITTIKPQIEETEVVEVKKNTIEDVFKENECYIFENIILVNLFNETNKYSDEGVFTKTQSYIKKYFEDIGFDWNSYSDEIQKLITTSIKWKSIAKQQGMFYDYFCTNKIDLRFEGHFSDWVKLVIDESYAKNKPLTKQYARILVGFYYFKTFCKKGTKESLYKNLLATISYTEFSNWISKDVNTSFEKLVKIIIKRFNKMDVLDLDERVLIIQLIKSKNFIRALKEFDFLDNSAKNSKYSNIYNEANEEPQFKSLNLNVKNIINEDYNKKSLDEKDCKIKESKNEIEGYDEKNINSLNSKGKINVVKENVDNSKLDVNVQTNNKVAIDDSNENIGRKKDNPVLSEYLPAKATDNQTNVCRTENNNKEQTIEKNIDNNVETKVNNKTNGDSVSKVSTNQTNIKDTKDVDFDKFLKKLGGTRNVVETSETQFLNSIVNELKNIESDISIDTISTVNQSYDNDFEDLLYF